MAGINPVNVGNYMDAIEKKLKNKQFSEPDSKMLSCIIESFGKTWKFIQTYPKLLEGRYDKQFNDIFADMSHTFHQESSLTYTCELCDKDIQIINNDLKFSYQMHEQSSEHKESLSTFKCLNDNTDDPLKNTNQDKQNNIMCISINIGKDLTCAICKTKLDYNNDLKSHLNGQFHKNFTKFEFTVKPEENDIVNLLISKEKKKGKQYYCAPCEIEIPNSPSDRPFERLIEHIKGRRHIYKCRKISKRIYTHIIL